MAQRTFETTIEPRPGGGVTIPIPFQPDEAWGARDRHHVAGTVEGRTVRGPISFIGDRPVLQMGPAWCRDRAVAAGARVTVVLAPEGPQLDTLPAELAAALSTDPTARRFFESLPTFYRNGFVRPIAQAKRAETRARRAAEALKALSAGRRTP
jgi:bacteriocin resistance YdeI/OmpD-like protein/uncharacterized protein DUF1905